MDNNFGQVNSTVLRNMCLFFDSASKAFALTGPIIRKNNLSPAYVQDVLFSLTANKKVIRTHSNKYWLFNGYMYKTLEILISDEFFINKIITVKSLYEQVGLKFLQFDPLFEKLSFLPLYQQKTILEDAITRHVGL